MVRHTGATPNNVDACGRKYVMHSVGTAPYFPHTILHLSPPTRTSLVSRMLVMPGSRLLQQHPHFLSSLYTRVHRPSLLEFAVDVEYISSIVGTPSTSWWIRESGKGINTRCYDMRNWRAMPLVQRSGRDRETVPYGVSNQLDLNTTGMYSKTKHIWMNVWSHLCRLFKWMRGVSHSGRLKSSWMI